MTLAEAKNEMTAKIILSVLEMTLQIRVEGFWQGDVCKLVVLLYT